MAYLFITIFAGAMAFGGFKHSLRQEKLNGISIAVILLKTLIFNFIPPIKAGNNVYISAGGVLLIFMGLAALFYKSDIGRQLLNLYFTFLLGLLFYVIQKAFIGVELTQLNKDNYYVYALQIIFVLLLSPNVKTAFVLSVLAPSITALLFYVADGTTYIIGGGDTYIIAVTISCIACLISAYVGKLVEKLYPRTREMLFEAAEEICPDELFDIKK